MGCPSHRPQSGRGQCDGELASGGPGRFQRLLKMVGGDFTKGRHTALRPHGEGGPGGWSGSGGCLPNCAARSRGGLGLAARPPMRATRRRRVAAVPGAPSRSRPAATRRGGSAHCPRSRRLRQDWHGPQRLNLAQPEQALWCSTDQLRHTGRGSGRTDRGSSECARAGAYGVKCRSTRERAGWARRPAVSVSRSPLVHPGAEADRAAVAVRRAGSGGCEGVEPGGEVGVGGGQVGAGGGQGRDEGGGVVVGEGRVELAERTAGGGREVGECGDLAGQAT